MILTNGQNEVQTLLRNSKHDAESRVTVGDVYPIAAHEEAPHALTQESLAAAMQVADGGTTAKQLLMRLLPLGREVAEHTLLGAGLAAGTKMATRPWEDTGLLERLERAAADASRMLAAVAENPGGIIVLKTAPGTVPTDAGGGMAAALAVGGAAAAAGDAAAADAGATVYDEFAPFEMAQHAGRRILRFGSFSEAIDDFFSKIEVQRAEAEHKAQQNQAWRKVDKIREAQLGRAQGLREKEAEDVARAQLLEVHAEEVDALLGLLRNGVGSGMDWRELQELIAESAKAGDALASLVYSLDLAR